MAHKLKNIHIIQKVSRIHIITDYICRGGYPATSIKSGPCAIIPVISPVLCGLMRRNTVFMNQASGNNTFILNHCIPVQPGLMRFKHPVGILGMKLSKRRFIAFRKSLGIEIRLEIGILTVGNRKTQIRAQYITGASTTANLIPKLSITACGLIDYSNRSSL